MAAKDQEDVKKEDDISSDEEEWQDKCEGLGARLVQARTRGLWTDCEVAIGSIPETVPAHRVLLAAASPVLASMLRKSIRTNTSIALPDVTPLIFNVILEYIYTDEINILSCSIACKLYEAAERLKLKKLASKCKTYLSKYVKAESVIQVYQFAKQYKNYELVEKCVKIIQTDTMTVLQHIEDAKAETLNEIFAMPHLVIDSELDLFKAAEHWLSDPICQTFKITIKDVEKYKNGTDIPSDNGEQRIYDLPWTVEFRKLATRTGNIVVFVECNKNHEGDKWACTADVSIRIISHKEGIPDLVLREPYTHRFHGYGMTREYYLYRFISTLKWDEMITPANGFVKDGAMIVETRIAARPPVYEHKQLNIIT